MLKTELDTPSLILDLELFEDNLRRMKELAEKAGKKLRPHAKTHKSSEIAKRQFAAGNCAGICAAKLSEAEKLADSGIQDVLITSPVADPLKINRLPALNSKISGLMLTADNPEQVKMLAAAAGKAGQQFRIILDLDPDMGRTGAAFADGVELGKFIASFPALQLSGVQCYAGHLQHVVSFEERKKADIRLMKQGAEVFHRLKALFPACNIFTGTGTGTMPADLTIPELTDIQVGSYCFMDAEYLAVEHGCGVFLPALRILTGVVSANHPGFVTIDAGTKAIYVTPGAPPRIIQGNRFPDGWQYDWSFGDEHGRLVLPSGITLKPGSRLEMCVSHCDPTINLFDVIYACRGNEVETEFRIDLRGCCR